MIEKKKASWKMRSVIQDIFVFAVLFVFQVLSGKLGWAAANLFSCEKVDPNGQFAHLSIHHLTQMLIALVTILIIGKAMKVDFGFHLGDKKTGFRYLLIFTGAIAAIALGYHLLMEVTGQPITYTYPLNLENIIGTLAFQLFLSGPSEEILFRALPITLLVLVQGKNLYISKNITLEVVLAALLFTAAHVTWTISPFAITNLNIFALIYAFAMGVLNGFVYQKSRSILYPILMHSISNVLMVGTGYLFVLFFSH